MLVFKKTINHPLSEMKGFTLIELIIVIALISILSTIAVPNYTSFRKRALDTTALSDTRNLVGSIIDAVLSEENVDYTKINTGGAVGDIDTVGNPRSPVFILSSGVAARITGDSNQAPGNITIFIANVYHTNGTLDPTSPSGRKEYFCMLDESTGVTSLP